MARAIEVPVVVKRGTLARSIEGEASTAFRKLGASSGSVAPLGRMFGKITADADEFTKSIEASNARVIAFGASVGVINGVANAFKQLVAVTVNVEKSLTDINVVLNASQKDIAKFGDGLFKVAKNTAQSFDVVAEAATEFARQGLSIEETLSRTNDALILTRLTGLKAADSVKGLTAATNGFAKAGLTTTQIINKLAAVDVKFAVSADDLIAALSRTGAVAQEAGMSMDELIGMVTAAQQTTARGGPVIGNALKTILTRVGRPQTLTTLRELKIAVEDASGAALPASKVLQNLANSYDGLSRSAKDAVNQQVAGVFQINILKAAVGDLQKQNSIAARATVVSSGATDQATKKNEMLNQTIAALTTQTGLALEELAKKIGDIALAPGMRDLISSFKGLAEGISGVLDGEGTGGTFARGLLTGIGNVLTGPGLIVIGGVFLKLFKDLSKFGIDSLKNLLGLNKAAQQQALLQKGIGQALAGNVAYENQMAAAAGNVNKQAAITQRFLVQEIALREQAVLVQSAMAGSMMAAGFRIDKGAFSMKGVKGKGRTPSFAPTDGEVPNFAIGRFGYRSPLTLATADPAVKEVMKVSGTKLEKYLPKTSGFRDAAVRLRKEEGFAGVDLSMANTLGLSGSQQPGLMAGMRGALKANPIQGIPSDLYGARNIQELGTSMSALYRSNPAAAGKFNQRMSDQVTEDYINKTMGLKSMGGTQGADTIFDSLKIGPGGIKNPVEIKKRLQDEATRGTLVKKSLFSETAPELRDFFMKNATKGEKRAMEAYLDKVWLDQYTAYSKSGIAGFGGHKGSADQIAAVRSYHKAVNFAPIGDAIKREKNQVGGLLGISPSKVQTKVIQNTALRSSFNPGGFGVISPTVGQNSFADAAKMHRGQDLRTVNLAPGLEDLMAYSRSLSGVVPGIDPMRPGLSMTPTGYSDIIKTTIHKVNPEAAKVLGGATGKALAREAKLAMPAPMRGGVKIPETSLTSGKNVKALEALAKPRGGGMMNFGMNAFMAYTAGTMAGGFAPQAEQMFGLRQGQGEGALTGGALGGFAGMKAGAALGSMLAPGAGTIIGGGIGLGAGALGGGYLGAAGLGNTVESVTSLGNVVTGTGDFRSPEEISFKKAQMTEFFGSQSATEADQFLQAIKDTRLNEKLTERQGDITRAGQQARLSRDIQAGRMGGFGGIRALDRQQEIDTGRRQAKQQIQDVETNAAHAEKFIRDIEKIIPAGTGGILGAQLKNQLRAMAAQGDFQGIQNIFESMRAENQPVLSGEKQGGIPAEYYASTTLPDVADAFRGDIGLRAPRRVGPTGASAIFMKETPVEKAMRANMGKIDPEDINRGITDNPEFADAITERGGVTAQSVMDLNTKLTEITRTNTEFVDGLRNATQAQKEMRDSFEYENEIEQTREALARLNEEMKHVDAVTSTMTSSLGNAFSAITTGSSSASDAFRNMAMSVLGEINRINSQFLASELMSVLPTQGLFKALTPTPTKQTGGVIKAQNGMYISGGRTGDKNPAMLEDGEYVLNRNAVKAMGGPGTLDSINFNMAPRFSRGGKLLSPVSSSGVRKKSLDKILAEYEAPATLTDPRLSGFAHANDPTLQNVRGDIKEYHTEQMNKKFEKVAKNDALIKMVVSAVVMSGVSQGVNALKGKFGTKPLTPDQFDKLENPNTATFHAPSPADAPAAGGYSGPLDMNAMAEDFAGSAASSALNPPGGPLIHRTSSGRIQTQKSVGKFVNQSTNFRSAANVMFEGGSFKDAYKEALDSGFGRYTDRPTGERAELAKIREMFGVKQPSKSQIGQYYLLKAQEAEKRGGIPGIQRGGYIDNIPAMLTGGEFVMNSSAVRRHGSGFFNKLNRGGRVGYQQGGLVGDQSVVQSERGATQQSNTSESTSNNTTINITVNSGGTEASVSTEGQPASKEKEMAMKIRGAVLSVIKEEKRTGGTLRDVTSET